MNTFVAKGTRKEAETIKSEWSKYGRDTTLSVYVHRESLITERERDEAALDGLYEYERKDKCIWF